MNQPDLVHNPGMAERSLSSGEFHGRLASVWERKYDVRLSFKARERILVEAILRHCRPGSHWVDAGCGTGRFSRRLAACGAGRVYGLDAALPMLEVARGLANEQQMADRIRFESVENLEHLLYPDHAFDGILCSSVLEYLEHPVAVLREFHRLLKPGGCLILSLPNRSAWLRKAQNACFHWTLRLGWRPRPAYLALVRNQYARDEAYRLLRESRFDVERLQFGGSGIGPDSAAFWGPLLFLEARRSDARARPVILMPVRSYAPGYKAGGPIRSSHALVQRLSARFQFKVITRDRETGDDRPFPEIETCVWSPADQASVFYMTPRGVRPWRLIRVIQKTPHDLLYLNSFFDPLFTLMPLIARRMGWTPRTPVIITPRGELAAGALSLKRIRKTLYLAMIRFFRSNRGVWWQAGSETERAVIIDALRLCDVTAAARVKVARDLADPFFFSGLPERRDPKRRGQLRAVFFSRISPIKNLQWAIRRLGAVAGEVSLDVMGPVSDPAYWKSCQAAAAEFPGLSFHSLGPIPHESVLNRLCQYDLFVFPTQGESFGHVILESLMAGCPVLISTATPWQDLEPEQAGWVIPLESPSRFEQTLQRVVEMDEAEHARWREGARRRGLKTLHDDQPAADHADMFTCALREGGDVPHAG